MALRRRWSYVALFSTLAMLGAACSGGSSKEASKKADNTQAASPPRTPTRPRPALTTRPPHRPLPPPPPGARRHAVVALRAGCQRLDSGRKQAASNTPAGKQAAANARPSRRRPIKRPATPGAPAPVERSVADPRQGQLRL